MMAISKMLMNRYDGKIKGYVEPETKEELERIDALRRFDHLPALPVDINLAMFGYIDIYDDTDVEFSYPPSQEAIVKLERAKLKFSGREVQKRRKVTKEKARQMVEKRCPNCGSSCVEKDWAVGYMICMRCNHSFTHAAGRKAYLKEKERY